MEQHPDVLPNGIVRKSGEVTAFNAGDVIAATVDLCREMGVPLAPQVKARLGKGSKGLIEAGFPPNIVVSACVVAIRTGWFGSVETIAQEMVVAAAGSRIGRAEYQQVLAATATRISKADSPVWQTMREEMARRAEPKEIE
jgi:hypothetical protein